MAASDARLFPLKNTAFRVTFPIYDNTGALVPGAGGLDSEVSIDGGTFADCTNEATEIATSSGIYYLDLTSGEMNGDTIAVLVKTTTTDAKTTVLVFYPTSTANAVLGVNAVSIASGAITATAIATDAIDADAIAASAVTEIQSGLATAAALADVPTANENADALLDRNVAGGSSGTRTVSEGISFLRNRWAISGGILTVYQEDGVTPLWGGSVSPDPNAQPIVGLSPS